MSNAHEIVRTGMSLVELFRRFPDDTAAEAPVRGVALARRLGLPALRVGSGVEGRESASDAVSVQGTVAAISRSRATR